MNRLRFALVFAAVAALVLFARAVLAPRADAGAKPIELLNVSYDPTRELFRELGERFAADHANRTGRAVILRSSHGGSGAQARAVIGGLRADLVTLALAYDIDALAARGLVAPDWQSRHPGNACPFSSTIVFLVRKGNPKNIRGWDDLVRPDVGVITPHPRTSGGARWNILAAWGHVITSGGTEAEALDFLTRLLARVPVLDTGARGATTTFVQKGLGDVLIAWESEAILAVREAGADRVEIVRPPDTIVAEPPIAIVDRNVDARGTRAAAEDFVRYLYSPEAQEIIARHGFRPSDPEVLARHAETFPPARKCFTLRDVAGSWTAAHAKFFAEGGIFDRASGPRE
jgi:sulfate/thiosulfate-binding protein